MTSIKIFFKNYNMYIVLLLFGIAIFMFGFEQTPFVSRISPNLIYLGIIIFMIYHYKSLHLYHFKHTLFFLVCLIFVILCSIYVLNVSTDENIFIDFRKYILVPFFYCCILALVVGNSKHKEILYFMFLVVGILYIHAILGSLFFVIYNGERVIPFGRAIGNYYFFSLLPLAISLGGILLTRYKNLFVMLFVISIISIVNNGERAIILAMFCMLCLPFCIMSYRYKKRILLLLAIFICAISFAFYHFSKFLDDKYNIHHMIENVAVVWSNTPHDMCKYIEFKRDDCLVSNSETSGITWEPSSLARLSMYKSAMMFISENLWMPNHIGINNMKVLPIYFKDNIENIPFVSDDHVHVHSEYLSVLLNYGIFGFLAIMLFNVGILIVLHKMFRVDNLLYRFFAFSSFLMLCGLYICIIFDVVFTPTIYELFIFYGVILGMWVRYKREL